MSLQYQLEKVLSQNDRMIRQRIHDAIVSADQDPTDPRFLHAIDNYRPAFSGRTELREVFSYGAIRRWSLDSFGEPQ